LKSLKDTYVTKIWENMFITKPKKNTQKICIFQILAVDPDCGLNGKIRYGILENEKFDNLFTLNSDTGSICVKNHLDFETQSIYQFNFVAEDGGKNYSIVFYHKSFFETKFQVVWKASHRWLWTWKMWTIMRPFSHP